MTLVERFKSALALILLQSEGWAELPGGPFFQDQGGLLLAGSRGAVFVVTGDERTAADVRAEKYRLVQWAQQAGMPPDWQAFSLLYAFEKGCPSDLRQEIVREDPSATVLSKTVQTGYVDLVDGWVALKPGNGVPPLARLGDAVRLAREVDVPLDPGEYRRLLASEEEKKFIFFERMRLTRPLCTILLIAACCAMFTWTWQASGEAYPPLASLPDWVLSRFGSCKGLLVRQGEWWRLVGALFLHAGLVHLGVNMYSLWIVGPMLERFYGHLRFLALFFFAGIVASLASATLSGHGLSNSVGASGAIFGLLGAMACAALRFRHEIPAGVRNSLARGMLICIGLNLAIGFSLKFVDNWAHIGGLVGGVVFALAVRPRALPDEVGLPSWRRVLAAAGLPLLILLAVAPMGVEGYVAWRAVGQPNSWGTTVLYQDASHRFSVQVPTPLVHRPDPDGRIIFVAEEGIQVQVLMSPWTAGDDLERNRALLLQILREEGIEPESGPNSSRVQTSRGRKWLLVAGTVEDMPARVACTVHQGRRYCLVMVAAAPRVLPLGDQALRVMIGSFRPAGR